MTTVAGHIPDQHIDLRPQARPREAAIHGFLFLCAALSILTTVGIVYHLGKESVSFFSRQQWERTNKTLVVDIGPEATGFEISESGAVLRPGDTVRVSDEIMQVTAVEGTVIKVARGLQGTERVDHRTGLEIFRSNKVSLVEFFTGTEWSPQIGKFGVWALVNATFMTSAIAMLVALPLGLGVAIYLSEYASDRVRSTLKPLLEVLAGIPTVVYGYFALTLMTPLLRAVFGVERVQIFNTASAGIVVGILILPLISSMSEDALSAVPRALREAAFGLGATKLETAVKVVLPAATSGIAAAFIVGISRALGETMIVAIAAGAGPNFTFNPFASAETMTGHIVRISGGDLSYDSIDYNSLFAIGLLLFLMTLGLNIFSQWIVRRFREVYE
ncbi:MAG: phosphate ABC transporter permease subunit PstC [Anaerolineae bacterium]